MSGKKSANAPKQLEWARKTLEAAGFEAPAALIPGNAESVIGQGPGWERDKAWCR